MPINREHHDHPKHPHATEALTGVAVALAALGVTGAVIHERHVRHHHQSDILTGKDEDPIVAYRGQAAILNDERITKRTQKLKHLNLIAARVLQEDRPTKAQLRETITDLNDKSFEHLLRILTVGEGLVVPQQQNNKARSYYYEPAPALQWAATQSGEYRLLTDAICELATSEM